MGKFKGMDIKLKAAAVVAAAALAAAPLFSCSFDGLPRDFRCKLGRTDEKKVPTRWRN